MWTVEAGGRAVGMGFGGRGERLPGRLPFTATRSECTVVGRSVTVWGSARPAFAFGEVGFGNGGVDVDTEAGLVVDADEAVLNIGAVEEQEVVHPAALTGDGFAGHEVADGSGPLAGGPGIQLAAGVVGGHRQAENGGHIGDPLGLEKTAPVAQIGGPAVATLVDDAALVPLAA